MYTETNVFAVIIPFAHATQSFPNVLQIEEMRGLEAITDELDK